MQTELFAELEARAADERPSLIIIDTLRQRVARAATCPCRRRPRTL
jgi:hypothetical protein